MEESTYDELEAPAPKSVYSARIDFPFFGDRLLGIQDFVITQCADDWRTLWRDRRDMNRFWTLWAVLIVGGITIVLGILQVSLAIAQLGAAYHT